MAHNVTMVTAQPRAPTPWDAGTTIKLDFEADCQIFLRKPSQLTRIHFALPLGRPDLKKEPLLRVLG